jgi:hypothetical protein
VAAALFALILSSARSYGFGGCALRFAAATLSELILNLAAALSVLILSSAQGVMDLEDVPCGLTWQNFLALL